MTSDKLLPYLIIIFMTAFGITNLFIYHDMREQDVLIQKSLTLAEYDWSRAEKANDRAAAFADRIGKLEADHLRLTKEVKALTSRMNRAEDAIMNDERARIEYQKAHGRGEQDGGRH